VLTFSVADLSSRAQEAVGGLLSVFAVGLVTWMIFWMRRTAAGLAAHLRGEVQRAALVGAGALTVTAFLAVGREGLETTLFLWTAARASGQTAAPLVGVAIGIAAAVALCWLLYRRGRLFTSNWYLRICQFTAPLGFIAVLAGWTVTEVGRQPWTVYGVLRTADSVTPFLTARAATISLIVFCAVYTFIFAFGVFYIHRLLRAGPEERLVRASAAAVPNRPMSVVDEAITVSSLHSGVGE